MATDSIFHCMPAQSCQYWVFITSQEASRTEFKNVKHRELLFPPLHWQIFIQGGNGILENFCSIQSLFSNANDIILWPTFTYWISNDLAGCVGDQTSTRFYIIRIKYLQLDSSNWICVIFIAESILEEYLRWFRVSA